MISENACYHFDVTLSNTEHGDEDFFKSVQPHLEQWYKDTFDYYIFQLERGKETLNLHYQGYAHKKTKVRAKQLAIATNSLFNGIRIVPASRAGIESLKTYCLKDDTRVSGPYSDRPVYAGQDLPVTLYSWQAEVVRIITEPADDRTIHYIFDPTGNTGKSKLVKILIYKYKVNFLCQAATQDLLYLVAHSPPSHAYVVDCTRSKPKSVAYSDLYVAIEQLKNGVIMSTKYTPLTVLRTPPHVIVFSNSFPKLGLLSQDRWKIWTIQNRTLIPYTK